MNKINFGKIGAPIDPPLLLKMQKDSFAGFLQKDVAAEKRKPQGLEGAFKDIFPLTNSDESLVLEYVSYAFGEPKYSVEESIARDATYALPLKVKLRLMHKKEDGKEKELSEQEVYFGDVPLMTDTATFIINGAERVVVSQIHRSPGVIFEEDEEKRVTVLGKPLYFARMIPYRGAWVEFEFDQNGIVYVRIDRKRKIYATTFLRSLGFESDDEILNLFRESKEVSLDAPSAALANEYVAEDIFDKSTGEIIVDAGKELKEELVKKLQEKGFTSVAVLKDASILITLKKDPIKSQKEAVNHIYKVLKTQEFIMQERAQGFLEELLFKSVRRYDLTTVGRYKILKKFGPVFEYFSKNFNLNIPADNKRTLTREDVVVTLKYLLALYNGETEFTEGKQTIKIGLDDIDHLGNRRVRSVGELLENQIRIGLVQMARLVKEHMNNQDKTNVTPRSLVNITQFVAQIRKFFGTSQLSQFMDQINPLAELTHKRRLSALGPGGLNRKRAGFEVRDVHHTHYGRVCPIETPEGPNIGLITSLATFARVNPYGLIETPYKKVEDGKATDKVDYLTADKEDEFFVAQANTPLDNKGNIVSDSVHGRRFDSFVFQPPTKVDYMDISPMQVISVSAGLIPFLEHDDANRALMGCNMQRQGVPLLKTEVPLVSTGIEEKVARDSGVVIISKSDGEVVSVSADEIMIASKSGEIEVYNLRKYGRSNQDTCIDQTPLVVLGDVVKKGQVIADGPATKDGQLALGQNLLVAYMPWDGYNFEDAMLLSEKLIQDDRFTSVHIREFQAEARETKGRPEEITKDIPNVGSEDLLNLDEDGVVKAGSYVQRGDILVGKTAPKGEQQTTPEERLLRVLFGKKAEDVQDASLRVPPGVSGKVIGVRTFVRLEKLSEKERKKKQEEIREVYDAAKAKLRKDKKEQLAGANKSESSQIESLYASKEEILKKSYEAEKERLKKGDELPVSVNKIVKVYIAAKLKVQVGDKLAGRHGNKGIVARILPVEDMPRLPDGTPVDCVLSPLAIPSRMNVGQLLEIMLGWAGKELKTQMITPVFDGATEEQIKDYVEKAKAQLFAEKKKSLAAIGLKGKELDDALAKFAQESLPTSDCKVTLYDGRTGEAFMEKVTVGVMYVMKLNHLVEDKMHARSTGPYSLITRQPLGGKAQFGGQRFGEMEVWAIEGYGAAHILQEFLTVKSDDVEGRVKMYDSIIRGESISEPGIPESFKVLVNELRALSLNVELLNKETTPKPEEKE
ncbi:DNA-directed RNA polymerase subunit beta [Endomicrobium proavitum]|uniref:DNA-directed RNA polymerase subunit beta n=1 Tax=Endomicrobium proavitum TaxID=1408281 RepID=A0A0G3WL94_9BACT|nr:DNA-directed RNA polymerase subunit beta [Endomicrobium proavitum]AKL98665.1 RNA polymerase, beta subunit [Endomicrobium proavitum]